MWISIDPAKFINTSTRLHKHNNLSLITWQTYQSSIYFVVVIFIVMRKARRSAYSMAFKIKVIAEAEAVENNSQDDAVFTRRAQKLKTTTWRKTSLSPIVKKKRMASKHRLKALAHIQQTAPLGATNFIKVHNQ